MSRSSTPWDDPVADRDRTGLPMRPDATPDPSPDVMASIDTAASRSSLVIADVTREDAWLSVDETDAPVLEEWC